MIAALGPRVTGLSLRVARSVVRWISVASAGLFRALRPLLMWFFRALAVGEAALRALGRGATRAATAGATVLTPRRAIGLVMAAGGALLVVSQFIDYRAVQIGLTNVFESPAGVAVAKSPTIDPQTAGHAHSYVLVPVGAIAVVLGLVLIARGGRAARWAALAAIVAGAASLAVILLVDLPHGLDVGAQSSRFAGASAVLEKGFSAELAATGAMLLSGLLYIARPCLIRINLSGRAASARRRRPRRRASSRATVARRA
jgi:hypothetical protein